MRKTVLAAICAVLLGVFAAGGMISAKAESSAEVQTVTLNFSDMMDATKFISTGSWEVDEGKFVEKSASGENFACYAYYFKDVTVEWTMSLASDNANAYGGIALRKQRPQDTAYQSGLTMKISGNGSVKFYNEAVDGSPVLAELPEGTITATEENTFKVTVIGTTYALYINGNETAAFSVENYYYGIGGFSLISGNAQVSFDDLKVTGKSLGEMSAFSGASGVGGENGGDDRYGDIDKDAADSDFNDKIGNTDDENRTPDWDFGEVRDNVPERNSTDNADGGCNSSVGGFSALAVVTLIASAVMIRRRKDA